MNSCKCGECDWKPCCKFFYFMMYDGDLDGYVEIPIDELWKMLAVNVPVEDTFNRFICSLQDVDGNCIIYPYSPVTCQLFTCGFDKMKKLV